MRFLNVGVATIAAIVMMACSPTEAKPDFEFTSLETYEKAPLFGALAYVDRDTIRKNKVRALRSVIRAEGEKSGIFYSYYFDRDGRLTASSPGFSPSTFHNFYDEKGRLEKTGYSKNQESEITGINPVENPQIMHWETQLQSEPHKVEINSACYSVNAQFMFILDPVVPGALPRSGRFEFSGDVPDFGFFDQERSLIAELNYEYFDVE